MKKILVLEDEASIRSFIVINLRRAGYDVIEAETGEEAMERLRANPDTKVALLDIMLPGIDGFEVCRRIRATNTKIGIIMLTARSQEMDKVTGLMTGADDYVTKPFSPAELTARVDALIRRWESGDMLRALALDCSAAAAVEQMCDQIELELQGHFPGCSFPFRYSPGYGDLPLELQNPLLDLLDAPRRVGLCASASHILTPRKSVTAILGAADGPIQPTVRSCLGCPARESCQYRKSGGHCGIS